jgi:hypothetical protein
MKNESKRGGLRDRLIVTINSGNCFDCPQCCWNPYRCTLFGYKELKVTRSIEQTKPLLHQLSECKQFQKSREAYDGR